MTASGQGIGLATVRAFAAEGAAVIATDIDPAKLEVLSGTSGIETRPLDVRDPNAVAEIAEEAGAVDILFNCAGRVPHGTILDCDPAAWDETLRLNVTGMYQMIRAFLPRMVDAGGGSIINMASVASSVIGAPNRCAYGASKAAVIGLTKSVAIDFIDAGIRCNAVCPGTVQTPSLDERINAFPDPAEARKAFIARQPMGRVGEPAEIAALCVYLAADESAFTTGQAFVIDGGFSL